MRRHDLVVSSDKNFTRERDRRVRGRSNPQALITGQDQPEGVAVDSSHIYWSSPVDGTINEASLDGSNLHAVITGQHFPVGVAVSPQ